MARPTFSRSAVMKAAHSRVAASRAFLASLAAKGFAEPAQALARFDYRKAFASALAFAWVAAKQEAERAADPILFAAGQRAWAQCATDGRLAA
ncbi:hypothetical protein [Salinarimonas soli]|uniref:Uncharacterized protein n=1 Tax=Salinarimonas soli TaxID=1638099 RepID=A0A5B2VS26_9HYPH|nr:hypothetical protein [Salinarimonas soli]KAA2241146.1 hypothetical protein F0L46_04935 [Salinarimonas soli]